MADNVYSFVQYVGDGTTRNFSVPFDYLDQDHVVVKVGGEDASFEWLDSNTIRLSEAPPSGIVIEVRRETSHESRRVIFHDGSVLTEDDLNDAVIHTFYMAQEAVDLARNTLLLTPTGEISARGRRLTDLADPQDPQDAATKGYVDNLFGDVEEFRGEIVGYVDRAEDAAVRAEYWSSKEEVQVQHARSGHRVLEQDQTQVHIEHGYWHETTLVIWLNGVKLRAGVDYDAPGPSYVWLLQPAQEGDVFEWLILDGDVPGVIDDAVAQAEAAAQEAVNTVADTAKKSQNLADLTNAAEARSNLGTFSTVADVQNSHIPPVLDSIRTEGYYGPGDGGGAPYKRVASEPSHAGKIQSADGAWWEDVGYNTITVRIPTDFDSLQSAVDFYSRFPIRNGAVIRLLIESGHQLTKGLYVQHGDYSRFVIESEDSVVELDAGFEPTFDPDGDGNILRVTAAAGPKLACVIDMDHRFGNAAYFTEGSRGHIENECGIINAGSHGLVVVSSQVDAHRSIWNGAKRSGIRATQASIVGAQGAKANDCASEAGSEGSFYCSRGSTLTVMLGEAKNSGASAIQCHRSYINAQGVDVSNPAEHAVLAQIYARVNINSATMEGCGGVPIMIRNGMCKVNAYNSTISSVSGGFVLQINTDGGAEVNLTGVTTPNSPEPGIPADEDIPSYMLYNRPTSRGIVWDGNRGHLRIAPQAIQRGNIDSASSTEIFYNQFSGGSPSGTANTAYFHIELPGDMGHQLAFRSNKDSPELYNRFRDSSGFGNWKKIAHVGDPLPSYTVATLPSPSPAGQVVYVSDDVDGPVLAFSDGSTWRRVTDRAEVTAV